MLKELICQDCGRVRKDITERFWVSRMEKDFTREWCAKCTPEKYRTVGHIDFLKEFPEGIEPMPEPERERWEYEFLILTNIGGEYTKNLNRFGIKGWELVSVDKGFAYFKRRLVE